MIAEIIKFFGVLLVASAKFMYSPPSAYLAGYSLVESILATTMGGIIGVYVFYKFGRFLSALWNRRFPVRKEKQKFTKKTRRFILFKNAYGLYGLAFITPCIISIPIGCLFAAKYYPQTKTVMFLMSISVVFWSVLLSVITYSIGPIFE